MKRFLSVAFVLAMFTALPLAAETVEGVVMDNMCMGKFKEKGFAGAKMHTKSCALMDMCKASGYAIIQKDGKVVKLDKKGNELAIKALEGTSKAKDLEVKADGKLKDGVLHTKSLQIL